MKKLAYLALTFVLFSSCNSEKIARIKMGAKSEKPAHPYVVLSKGNTTVEANTVTKVGTSVLVDDKKYKISDVTIYSNGMNTFANVGDERIAKEIFTGDISGYLHQYDKEVLAKSGGHHYRTTEHHQDYYVHKTGSPDFGKLDYKFVKKLILPGDPGYDYMRSCRNSHVIKIVSGILGSTAAVTAVVLGFSKAAANGPTPAIYVCAGVWLGSVITYHIKSNREEEALHKAIGTHNGLTYKD